MMPSPQPVRLVAFLVIGALSASLLACAHTPDRNRKALPIAESFSAKDGTRMLAGNWWKGLGDPTLDRYIVDALSTNFSLAATRVRLVQAQADASVVSGGALPSITSELDITNRTDLGDSPVFAIKGTTWSAGLAASYEVDVWGGIRSAKQSAKASVFAARFDVEAAAISLSAEVAIAWYRWIESVQQYELRLEQSEISTQILALVEARYARGQVSGQEVFRQRQIVDAAKQSEVESSTEGLRWRNRLATLLAKRPDELTLPSTVTLVQITELPSVGTPLEVIKQRPDLRASYQRLIAADAAAATALTNRYPRLSLRAGVTTSSKSVSSLFQNWLLSIAGNILTPLFDGGVLKARARSAESAAQAAWLDYAAASLSAVVEIENALLSDVEVRSRVASLTRQVDLAQRGLEIARAGYVAGQVTYLQALDAVLSLQGLQRSLLESRRNAILARITLHRAVAGRILNEDESEDDGE